MKKYFLTYLFVLIMCSSLFSQATKNDTLVCDLLLNKLKKYANQANDSANDCYNNLLSYARHYKMGFYIAESIN
ncbi:MAG TPA: hypothetical protein PLP65_11225, partial [Bacteroidales bacterium]|nr:hypothetical protein [Bacteroidales bacterium]